MPSDREMRDEAIAECFDSFNDDAVFFWFDSEKEQYIGVIDEPNQGITYARSKQSIIETLRNYHPDFIEQVYIYPESGTKGLPNPDDAAFIGYQWTDAWDAVA